MDSVVNAEQPVARQVVLDAQLVDAVHVHRVEVRMIRIMAGHAAGRHIHNGPVLGSIVEGSVRFQVEGEAETVLRTGDVFFEPAGVGIAHFDALSEDVAFLAYFLLGPGQEPEIEVFDA